MRKKGVDSDMTADRDVWRSSTYCADKGRYSHPCSSEWGGKLVSGVRLLRPGSDLGSSVIVLLRDDPYPPGRRNAWVLPSLGNADFGPPTSSVVQFAHLVVQPDVMPLVHSPTSPPVVPGAVIRPQSFAPCPRVSWESSTPLGSASRPALSARVGLILGEDSPPRAGSNDTKHGHTMANAVGATAF
ncbi:hypothetical protein RR46_14931 [Papilio xuthus]|uniref:Uncharacterized protein n=1 Tax=Papilio xuthus TaxID=66420 RepID=A0A194PDU0_PAPXU|nr:hypothetical protein RR46_14931 [Papilio xuthus]